MRFGAGVQVAVLLAFAGCGRTANDGADEEPTGDEMVQVPVYLMRPDPPPASAEPSLNVDAFWSAVSADLSGRPIGLAVMAVGECLSSSAGGQGTLMLTLGESVDLAAIGVTGVHFTSGEGETSSELTFGFADDGGRTHCGLAGWGDDNFAFADVGGECPNDGDAVDVAEIRTLFWTAELDVGAEYGFCVTGVRLIDDSYLP